uniref:PUA domain-containing protein n=1 Tax=Paenibacillus polymyxa TaxID=1406 RepID=A0AAE9PSW7_PAEPO
MPSVILERSRKKRLEHAHPWVFKNEIAKIEGDPEAGDLVSIVNHQGRYLATGYYNPASQITVRVMSYEPLEAMDQNFLPNAFANVWSTANVL